MIERAAPLFDKLVVLVAINPIKSPMFSVEDRLAMIHESAEKIANVGDATNGTVVSYAQVHGASFLIRGIRGATDAEYETSLAHVNWMLAPDVTTLFIPAHPDLSEVSSSRLKELALRGEALHRYAPPAVLRRLAAHVTLSAEELLHERI